MVHIVKKSGEGPMVPSHLNFLDVGDSSGGDGAGVGVVWMELKCAQTNTKDNTSTPLH